jgi:large subunit ribosomal protein L30
MKMAKDKKTVTIVRTGSMTNLPHRQRQTLVGLGLTKTNQTRQLEDTPSVRGMINKVAHLVKVVSA